MTEIKVSFVIELDNKEMTGFNKAAVMILRRTGALINQLFSKNLFSREKIREK